MIKGTLEDVWINVVKTDNRKDHTVYLCYLNIIGKRMIKKDLKELKLFQVMDKLK